METLKLVTISERPGCGNFPQWLLYSLQGNRSEGRDVRFEF